MYDYPFSAEIVRLTIILGIVISTLIYKRTGMTMGGVIIPGYLALYLVQPFHLLATLVIATLAYIYVHNTLKRRYMLNGRRLFEVEIIVALVLQITWSALLSLFTNFNPIWASMYGIGFVIPGLITHEIGRQGWSRTMYTTLLGTLLVFIIITPLSAIEQQLPKWLLATSHSLILRTQPYTYSFPLKLLPIAIIISIMVDLIVARRFQIRPGGFVTAAYVALFLLRPLDLLFVLASALLTYLIVRYFTNRYLLVFGRTKLGFIILLAVVIAWLLEILMINVSQGSFAPWSGFVIIMPLLVALLTNSFDQQGIPRSLAAVTISGGVVWLTMQGLVWILNALNIYIYFKLPL